MKRRVYSANELFDSRVTHRRDGWCNVLTVPCPRPWPSKGLWTDPVVFVRRGMLVAVRSTSLPWRACTHARIANHFHAASPACMHSLPRTSPSAADTIQPSATSVCRSFVILACSALH